MTPGYAGSSSASRALASWKRLCGRPSFGLDFDASRLPVLHQSHQAIEDGNALLCEGVVNLREAHTRIPGNVVADA